MTSPEAKLVSLDLLDEHPLSQGWQGICCRCSRRRGTVAGLCQYLRERRDRVTIVALWEKWSGPSMHGCLLISISHLHLTPASGMAQK